MDEMLPCPHCGGDAGERQIAGCVMVIRCRKCGADGAARGTALEAIIAWNLRTAQPAPVVLTEEEMEARWRAWLQRKNRLDRIAALRTPQSRDAHDEEERAAAIAMHEAVIEMMTRFALTGVR